MTIREHIQRLTVKQRQCLSHAFDNDIPQHLVINGTNEFVGVHLDQRNNTNLIIEQVVGMWSYGKVKGVHNA